MEKEILTLEAKTYNKETLERVKKIRSKPIGYITLNKTYRALLESFKEHNVDTQEFYFIDAITPTVLKEKKQEKCIYLESITNTDTFAESIMQFIASHKCKHLIFDSLSSFLVYNDDKKALNFFNYILSYLERFKINITIFVLKEDKINAAVKQLIMRADKLM